MKWHDRTPENRREGVYAASEKIKHARERLIMIRAWGLGARARDEVEMALATLRSALEALDRRQ